MVANQEFDFNYNKIYYHAWVFDLGDEEKNGYKVFLFKDKKPKIILIWSEKHVEESNLEIEWTSNNGIHDNSFVRTIFEEIERSKKI
jgi:hypothetical protein